jgi:DNA-binding response OmpR family regulator
LVAPTPSSPTRIGPNSEYDVKPFHYAEVSARIRAVLRRRSSQRDGPRRVGDVFIDPSRREVKVGDRRVTLANKELSDGCPV